MPSKYDIASDPTTSPDILASLSQNQDYLVQWRVAANPSTPPNTLTILSKDSNSVTRSYVAMNPSTPQGILILLLTQDPDWSVRWDGLLNPQSPYGTWTHWGRNLP